jgi:hypothetical protein
MTFRDIPTELVRNQRTRERKRQVEALIEALLVLFIMAGLTVLAALRLIG